MIKIRPRDTTFDASSARLAELGVTFAGYDHRDDCYAGIVIPPGVETALEADPLIEVDWNASPGRRKTPRGWSSPPSGVDLKQLGVRLRELRIGAGFDLQFVSTLTSGKLSPDTINRIEDTGKCDARHLIVLADLYGASLDKIAGRSVSRGDRRR